MADFDAERVRALRAGDGAAFADLARQLGARLRAMAMRYFRTPFEQEEAVQEALLHVFKSREHLDPLRADTVAPWVLKVAQRKMIDLQRASASRPQLAEDDALPDLASPQSPEDEAFRAELRQVIDQLEAKLKPAWRPYFRAVFIEGQDFDEAREQLGLGRLRAKYLKRVLMRSLRRHRPLLEALERRSA